MATAVWLLHAAGPRGSSALGSPAACRTHHSRRGDHRHEPDGAGAVAAPLPRGRAGRGPRPAPGGGTPHREIRPTLCARGCVATSVLWQIRRTPTPRGWATPGRGTSRSAPSSTPAMSRPTGVMTRRRTCGCWPSPPNTWPVTRLPVPVRRRSRPEPRPCWGTAASASPAGRRRARHPLCRDLQEVHACMTSSRAPSSNSTLWCGPAVRPASCSRRRATRN